MDVVYERCCGLDVHKKSITACIMTPDGKEIQTFGTMTEDLLSLVDWIKSKGCTHVAMESTGVYWKPIYNLLELEEIQTLVVNAQHIKAVPGRKTDVKDAEWIANLLRHGLLQGSYIPDRKQRELRELIRYRRSLIDERAREVNRIQKVLEGANIKLSSVATNVLGKSGRAMMEAMIQGVDDPAVLSELAQRRLKNKKGELERALQGLIGPHQKLMLSTQLQHIDFLDQQIAKLDEEIKARMLPFEEDLELLDTIPGVGRRTAEQILAEIGTDMNRFPTAAHLCSWAGMAPGNNESAGKRRSGRTRKGNKKLRSALVEAARAAARTKNTYLSAQYNRLAARRGANRAAVAVGHTILTITYYILVRKQSYIELGADYYEQRKKDAVIKQSIKRLESLGYKVKIEEIA
ncbi:IS110 family transposase [Effusibacillus lacus]|uniref:Transposase n=1 Tax=Effusibacillus lacus TaxID=1348429 RepID=A0A292YGG4_9BACL|nr:IS110 family transposase [Effusibacillus lacus]TCS68536.1 transposase [Effusibacillus lacus]GAX88418.1 transposase [Effusibacillus lacus]